MKHSVLAYECCTTGGTRRSRHLFFSRRVVAETMGIHGLHALLKDIERRLGLSYFRGLHVGIDGNGWLVRCSKRVKSSMPRQAKERAQCYKEAVVTETCQFFKTALTYMAQLDMKVTIVFDGAPLPIKEEHKKRLGSHVLEDESWIMSKDVYAQIRKNLSQQRRRYLPQLSLQLVVAPYEADSQLAFLYRQKVIDFVISEDYDLLCYGVHFVFSKYEADGTGVLIDLHHLGAAKSAGLDFTGFDDVMFRVFW